MNRDEFDERETQAAWDLLGRQRGIEPSFGFAQRTLRRLHETPERRFWQWPAFRWATALGCVIAIAAGAFTVRHRAEARRHAEVYAVVQQDYLEDFDVIAALDQLEENHNL